MTLLESKNFRLLVKVVAWVTVFTFTFEQVVFADGGNIFSRKYQAKRNGQSSVIASAVGEANEAKQSPGKKTEIASGASRPRNDAQKLTTHPSGISIPADAGTIEGVYNPQSAVNPSASLGTGSPQKIALENLVIHIQDAHANYGAQKNEAKIIEHLLRTNNINKVLVEGGWGDVSLNDLRKLASLDIRKKVTDEYLKQARMHGEEVLNLASDIDFKLYGIEDKALYEENLKAFLDSSESADFLKQAIDKLKTKTDLLKQKIYSPALLELDRVIARSKATKPPSGGRQSPEIASLTSFARNDGPIDTSAYLIYLKDLAVKNNLPSQDYESIAKFTESDQLSKTLDIQKINQERIKAIEDISKRLTNLKMKDFMNLSMRLKDGKIRQAEYYAAMRAIAKENGINFEQQYKNLNLYIDYLQISDNINPNEIFKSADKLETRLLGALAKSKKEKTLIDLCQHLIILEKLFNLQMVPDEYQLYTEIKNDLAKKELENSFGQLGENIKGIIPDNFDRLTGSFERFYQSAAKRDEVFVNNVTAAINETKGPVIMVAGGFHTAHLKEMFINKGMAYAVIAPKVDEFSDRQLYYNSLKGIFSPLEKIFAAGGIKTSGLRSLAVMDKPGAAGALGAVLQDAQTRGIGNFILDETETRLAKTLTIAKPITKLALVPVVTETPVIETSKAATEAIVTKTKPIAIAQAPKPIPAVVIPTAPVAPAIRRVTSTTPATPEKIAVVTSRIPATATLPVTTKTGTVTPTPVPLIKSAPASIVPIAAAPATGQQSVEAQAVGTRTVILKIGAFIIGATALIAGGVIGGMLATGALVLGVVVAFIVISVLFLTAYLFLHQAFRKEISGRPAATNLSKLNDRNSALYKEVIEGVRKDYRAKGYSEDAIDEIVRWMEPRNDITGYAKRQAQKRNLGGLIEEEARLENFEVPENVGFLKAQGMKMAHALRLTRQDMRGSKLNGFLKAPLEIIWYFLVRFPIHLFDIFILRYLRQTWDYYAGGYRRYSWVSHEEIVDTMVAAFIEVRNTSGPTKEISMTTLEKIKVIILKNMFFRAIETAADFAGISGIIPFIVKRGQMYFWSSVVGSNILHLIGTTVIFGIPGLGLAIVAVGIILWLLYISKNKPPRQQLLVVLSVALVVLLLVAAGHGFNIPITEIGLPHGAEAPNWLLKNFNFTIGGFTSPTILSFFLNYFESKKRSTDRELVNRFFEDIDPYLPRPRTLDAAGLHRYINDLQNNIAASDAQKLTIYIHLLALLNATPQIIRASTAEKLRLGTKIIELTGMDQPADRPVLLTQINNVDLGDIKTKIKEAQYAGRENMIWNREFWVRIFTAAFGIWTVQGEINAVLFYAHGLDWLTNNVSNWFTKHLLGRSATVEVTPFHNFASFIEGNPQSGENSLRNVGALGWVNYGFDQIYSHTIGYNPFEATGLVISGRPMDTIKLDIEVARQTHKSLLQIDGIVNSLLAKHVPKDQVVDKTVEYLKQVDAANKARADKSKEKPKIPNFPLSDVGKDWLKLSELISDANPDAKLGIFMNDPEMAKYYPQIFDIMGKAGIKIIYVQGDPFLIDMSPDEQYDFLKAANDNGIEVSLGGGHPDWFKDKAGEGKRFYRELHAAYSRIASRGDPNIKPVAYWLDSEQVTDSTLGKYRNFYTWLNSKEIANGKLKTFEGFSLPIDKEFKGERGIMAYRDTTDPIVKDSAASRESGNYTIVIETQETDQFGGKIKEDNTFDREEGRIYQVMSDVVDNVRGQPGFRGVDIHTMRYSVPYLVWALGGQDALNWNIKAAIPANEPKVFELSPIPGKQSIKFQDIENVLPRNTIERIARFEPEKTQSVLEQGSRNLGLSYWDNIRGMSSLDIPRWFAQLSVNTYQQDFGTGMLRTTLDGFPASQPGTLPIQAFISFSKYMEMQTISTDVSLIECNTTPLAVNGKADTDVTKNISIVGETEAKNKYKFVGYIKDAKQGQPILIDVSMQNSGPKPAKIILYLTLGNIPLEALDSMKIKMVMPGRDGKSKEIILSRNNYTPVDSKSGILEFYWNNPEAKDSEGLRRSIEDRLNLPAKSQKTDRIIELRPGEKRTVAIQIEGIPAGKHSMAATILEADLGMPLLKDRLGGYDMKKVLMDYANLKSEQLIELDLHNKADDYKDLSDKIRKFGLTKDHNLTDWERKQLEEMFNIVSRIIANKAVGVPTDHYTRELVNKLAVDEDDNIPDNKKAKAKTAAQNQEIDDPEKLAKRLGIDVQPQIIFVGKNKVTISDAKPSRDYINPGDPLKITASLTNTGDVAKGDYYYSLDIINTDTNQKVYIDNTPEGKGRSILLTDEELQARLETLREKGSVTGLYDLPAGYVQNIPQNVAQPIEINIGKITAPGHYSVVITALPLDYIKGDPLQASEQKGRVSFTVGSSLLTYKNSIYDPNPVIGKSGVTNRVGFVNVGNFGNLPMSILAETQVVEHHPDGTKHFLETIETIPVPIGSDGTILLPVYSGFKYAGKNVVSWSLMDTSFEKGKIVYEIDENNKPWPRIMLVKEDNSLSSIETGQTTKEIAMWSHRPSEIWLKNLDPQKRTQDVRVIMTITKPSTEGEKEKTIRVFTSDFIKLKPGERNKVSIIPHFMPPSDTAKDTYHVTYEIIDRSGKKLLTINDRNPHQVKVVKVLNSSYSEPIVPVKDKGESVYELSSEDEKSIHELMVKVSRAGATEQEKSFYRDILNDAYSNDFKGLGDKRDEMIENVKQYVESRATEGIYLTASETAMLKEYEQQGLNVIELEKELRRLKFNAPSEYIYGTNLDKYADEALKAYADKKLNDFEWEKDTRRSINETKQKEEENRLKKLAASKLEKDMWWLTAITTLAPFVFFAWIGALLISLWARRSNPDIGRVDIIEINENGQITTNIYRSYCDEGEVELKKATETILRQPYSDIARQNPAQPNETEEQKKIRIEKIFDDLIAQARKGKHAVIIKYKKGDTVERGVFVTPYSKSVVDPTEIIRLQDYVDAEAGRGNLDGYFIKYSFLSAPMSEAMKKSGVLRFFDKLSGGRIGINWDEYVASCQADRQVRVRVSSKLIEECNLLGLDPGFFAVHSAMNIRPFWPKTENYPWYLKPIIAIFQLLQPNLWTTREWFGSMVCRNILSFKSDANCAKPLRTFTALGSDPNLLSYMGRVWGRWLQGHGYIQMEAFLGGEAFLRFYIEGKPNLAWWKRLPGTAMQHYNELENTPFQFLRSMLSWQRVEERITYPGSHGNAIDDFYYAGRVRPVNEVSIGGAETGGLKIVASGLSNGNMVINDEVYTWTIQPTHTSTKAGNFNPFFDLEWGDTVGLRPATHRRGDRPGEESYEPGTLKLADAKPDEVIGFSVVTLDDGTNIELPEALVKFGNGLVGDKVTLDEVQASLGINARATGVPIVLEGYYLSDEKIEALLREVRPTKTPDDYTPRERLALSFYYEDEEDEAYQNRVYSWLGLNTAPADFKKMRITIFERPLSISLGVTVKASESFTGCVLVNTTNYAGDPESLVHIYEANEFGRIFGNYANRVRAFGERDGMMGQMVVNATRDYHKQDMGKRKAISDNNKTETEKRDTVIPTANVLLRAKAELLAQQIYGSQFGDSAIQQIYNMVDKYLRDAVPDIDRGADRVTEEALGEGQGTADVLQRAFSYKVDKENKATPKLWWTDIQQENFPERQGVNEQVAQELSQRRSNALSILHRLVPKKIINYLGRIFEIPGIKLGFAKKIALIDKLKVRFFDVTSVFLFKPFKRSNLPVLMTEYDPDKVERAAIEAYEEDKRLAGRRKNLADKDTAILKVLSEVGIEIPGNIKNLDSLIDYLIEKSIDKIQDLRHSQVGDTKAQNPELEQRLDRGYALLLTKILLRDAATLYMRQDNDNSKEIADLLDILSATVGFNNRNDEAILFEAILNNITSEDGCIGNTIVADLYYGTHSDRVLRAGVNESQFADYYGARHGQQTGRKIRLDEVIKLYVTDYKPMRDWIHGSFKVASGAEEQSKMQSDAHINLAKGVAGADPLMMQFLDTVVDYLKKEGALISVTGAHSEVIFYVEIKNEAGDATIDVRLPTSSDREFNMVVITAQKAPAIANRALEYAKNKMPMAKAIKINLEVIANSTGMDKTAQINAAREKGYCVTGVPGYLQFLVREDGAHSGATFADWFGDNTPLELSTDNLNATMRDLSGKEGYAGDLQNRIKEIQDLAKKLTNDQVIIKEIENLIAAFLNNQPYQMPDGLSNDQQNYLRWMHERINTAQESIGKENFQRLIHNAIKSHSYRDSKGLRHGPTPLQILQQLRVIILPSDLSKAIKELSPDAVENGRIKMVGDEDQLVALIRHAWTENVSGAFNKLTPQQRETQLRELNKLYQRYRQDAIDTINDQLRAGNIDEATANQMKSEIPQEIKLSDLAAMMDKGIADLQPDEINPDGIILEEGTRPEAIVRNLFKLMLNEQIWRGELYISQDMKTMVNLFSPIPALHRFGFYDTSKYWTCFGPFVIWPGKLIGRVPIVPRPLMPTDAAVDPNILNILGVRFFAGMSPQAAPLSGLNRSLKQRACPGLWELVEDTAFGWFAFSREFGSSPILDPFTPGIGVLAKIVARLTKESEVQNDAFTRANSLTMYRSGIKFTLQRMRKNMVDGNILSVSREGYANASYATLLENILALNSIQAFGDEQKTGMADGYGWINYLFFGGSLAQLWGDPVSVWIPGLNKAYKEGLGYEKLAELIPFDSAAEYIRLAMGDPDGMTWPVDPMVVAGFAREYEETIILTAMAQLKQERHIALNDAEQSALDQYGQIDGQNRQEFNTNLENLKTGVKEGLRAVDISEFMVAYVQPFTQDRKVVSWADRQGREFAGAYQLMGLKYIVTSQQAQEIASMYQRRTQEEYNQETARRAVEKKPSVLREVEKGLNRVQAKPLLSRKAKIVIIGIALIIGLAFLLHMALPFLIALGIKGILLGILGALKWLFIGSGKLYTLFVLGSYLLHLWVGLGKIFAFVATHFVRQLIFHSYVMWFRGPLNIKTWQEVWQDRQNSPVDFAITVISSLALIGVIVYLLIGPLHLGIALWLFLKAGGMIAHILKIELVMAFIAWAFMGVKGIYLAGTQFIQNKTKENLVKKYFGYGVRNYKEYEKVILTPRITKEALLMLLEPRPDNINSKENLLRLRNVMQKFYAQENWNALSYEQLTHNDALLSRAVEAMSSLEKKHPDAAFLSEKINGNAGIIKTYGLTMKEFREEAYAMQGVVLPLIIFAALIIPLALQFGGILATAVILNIAFGLGFIKLVSYLKNQIRNKLHIPNQGRVGFGELMLEILTPLIIIGGILLFGWGLHNASIFAEHHHLIETPLNSWFVLGAPISGLWTFLGSVGGLLFNIAKGFVIFLGSLEIVAFIGWLIKNSYDKASSRLDFAGVAANLFNWSADQLNKNTRLQTETTILRILTGIYILIRIVPILGILYAAHPVILVLGMLFGLPFLFAGIKGALYPAEIISILIRILHGIFEYSFARPIRRDIFNISSNNIDIPPIAPNTHPGNPNPPANATGVKTDNASDFTETDASATGRFDLRDPFVQALFDPDDNLTDAEKARLVDELNELSNVITPPTLQKYQAEITQRSSLTAPPVSDEMPLPFDLNIASLATPEELLKTVVIINAGGPGNRLFGSVPGAIELKFKQMNLLAKPTVTTGPVTQATALTRTLDSLSVINTRTGVNIPAIVVVSDESDSQVRHDIDSRSETLSQQDITISGGTMYPAFKPNNYLHVERDKYGRPHLRLVPGGTYEGIKILGKQEERTGQTWLEDFKTQGKSIYVVLYGDDPVLNSPDFISKIIHIVSQEDIDIMCISVPKRTPDDPVGGTFATSREDGKIVIIEKADRKITGLADIEEAYFRQTGKPFPFNTGVMILSKRAVELAQQIGLPPHIADRNFPDTGLPYSKAEEFLTDLVEKVGHLEGMKIALAQLNANDYGATKTWTMVLEAMHEMQLRARQICQNLDITVEEGAIVEIGPNFNPNAQHKIGSNIVIEAGAEVYLGDYMDENGALNIEDNKHFTINQQALIDMQNLIKSIDENYQLSDYGAVLTAFDQGIIDNPIARLFDIKYADPQQRIGPEIVLKLPAKTEEQLRTALRELLKDDIEKIYSLLSERNNFENARANLLLNKINRELILAGLGDVVEIEKPNKDANEDELYQTALNNYRQFLSTRTLQPFVQEYAVAKSTGKEIAEGVKIQDVEIRQENRWAKGRAIEIDPSKVEFDLYYNPQALDLDLGRSDDTTKPKQYKPEPGGRLLSEIAETESNNLAAEGKNLIAVTNSLQSNFKGAPQFLIVNGEFIRKHDGIRSIGENVYEPLNGDYAVFVLDKGKIRLQRVKVEDNVLLDSEIQNAISSPELVINGRDVSGRIRSKTDERGPHPDGCKNDLLDWDPRFIRAAFSAIGVKDDGTIVILNVAGEPDRTDGITEISIPDIAKAMLELGVKNAVLLEGSGGVQQWVKGQDSIIAKSGAHSETQNIYPRPMHAAILVSTPTTATALTPQLEESAMEAVADDVVEQLAAAQAQAVKIADDYAVSQRNDLKEMLITELAPYVVNGHAVIFHEDPYGPDSFRTLNNLVQLGFNRDYIHITDNIDEFIAIRNRYSVVVVVNEMGEDIAGRLKDMVSGWQMHENVSTNIPVENIAKEIYTWL